MQYVRTLLTLSLAAMLALASPARADDDPAARRRARRTQVVEAVERAAPSVVSIGTTQLVRVRRFWEWDFLIQERPGALGSGVIVHPRGYVVTNAHVINQAAQISVKLTGMGREDEIPAELVAVDLEHDLALLKMAQEGPFPAADFGSTGDLMVGETVIAMGNPFGLGRTVTTGVVSALRRDFRIRDQMFEGLVQTDAAVNQGNSGGALLNILGEWIGVNSAIYSLSGGSDGISFAIPIEIVRGFLVAAMRPRRIARRWIGAEFGEREDGTLEIDTVYPVGPAATAGLRKGMRLVDEKGRPQRDLVALTYRVLEALDDGAVQLHVSDGEHRQTVRLTFEELPTQQIAWSRLGLRCAEITPAITERTGYREGAGVLVTKVREGSAAERIGVREGDLLIDLASRRVRTLEHVLVLLQFVKSEEAVDVKLVRPQRTRFGVNYDTWKARLVAD